MSDVVYATAEQLRAQVDVESTAMDAVLEEMLEAASRAIDGVCNRPDGFVALETPEARDFRGEGAEHLRIDECVEVDEVILEGKVLEDWYAYRGSARHPSFRPPYYGLLREGRRIFPRSRTPNVVVSARWGYAEEVPAHIQQAALAQAARWWMRGRSAWADASMPEPGMGILLYQKTVDPDIAMMLREARMVRVRV